MRGEELLEKMALIDAAYIETAEHLPKRTRLVRWGALAACIVLLVGAAVGWRLMTPDLPRLTVSQNENSAMGFEGLMAYDVSELVNANPWNAEMELSTLPVYKNPLNDENYPLLSGGDTDKMRRVLLEVAERLGLSADTLTVTETYSGDLRTEAPGITLSVDQALTATIYFDPAIPLPESYDFTYHASYEDVAAVAEHLKTEYKDLLAMDNPQVNIHGGDYDIYARQGYSIEFFEGGGSEVERLMEYHFNRVTFAANEEGKLFIARVHQPDRSDKMGDYPVISVEQATDLLKNGHFITTVPEDFPGAEAIRKVELVYRTGEWEGYFMPYYRFYLELSEMKLNDKLNTYGAYYVPAVAGEYISDMPTWDGRFNG